MAGPTLDRRRGTATLVIGVTGNVRSKSFDGMVCSIAGVLDAVGDRWAMLILRDLSLGLSKYEELRQSTDITHATLSDRLKHLEENELIERRQYQWGPDSYEYLLTRK